MTIPSSMDLYTLFRADRSGWLWGHCPLPQDLLLEGSGGHILCKFKSKWHRKNALISSLSRNQRKQIVNDDRIPTVFCKLVVIGERA